MRILHVGHNDGSHITNCIKLQRELGHESQGLCFYWSKIQDYDGIKVYKKWQFVFFYLRFFYEAVNADIIHLWSEQVPLVVWWIRFLNRTFVIEWTGSDIRIPGLMYKGYKSKGSESALRSLRNQEKFKDILNIVSSPVLKDHVTNNCVFIPHRVYFSDKLKVAHAPSSRETKGTLYVLEAVKDLPIEFDLIVGVEHKDCIDRISKCDVFLDQFVWGESGMAAREAMSLGKPVLCWVNHDLPTGVINTPPNKIRDKLIEYINHPLQVKIDGLKCRQWLVEHNPIDELMEVYKSEMGYKGFFKRRYKANPYQRFIDYYNYGL